MNKSTKERVYDFIVEYKRTHDGVAPSVRDIAEEIYGANGSTSMAAYHVNKLIADGDLVRIGGRSSRDLMVVGARWLPPEEVGDE